MELFFTIFAAVVALNAFLLIFSTSVRAQRKEKARTSVSLRLEDFRIKPLDTEYRKAV